MPGADRVALVVYTDLTFSAERGIPHLDLGRALETAFRRGGFDIAESACVAADGWGSYLERAHRDQGRSLSELEQSDLGRRVAAMTPPGELLEHARTPEASPERRALVAELLACGPELPLAGLDLVDVVEGAMAARELTPPTIAGLLWVLRAPATRDVVLLQCAYGPAVGALVYDENGRYLEIQSRTGETMDDLVQREMSEGSVDRLSGDLLMGATEIVPERARFVRACEMLRELAAAAPPESLAPVLTCLAWFNWALGRGSAAGVLLDRVSAIEPGYGLAEVLRVWFGSGALPEWLFSSSPPQAARG